jgi:hypothetical protein
LHPAQVDYGPSGGFSIIKIGIDTDMPDLKVATSLVGLQPGQEKLKCYSGAKQSQEVHPSSPRPSSKTAIYSLAAVARSLERRQLLQDDQRADTGDASQSATRSIAETVRCDPTRDAVFQRIALQYANTGKNGAAASNGISTRRRPRQDGRRLLPGRTSQPERLDGRPVADRRNRDKEVPMIKSAVYAAIGFAAISSIALAEDLSSATAPLPPGTFTTSAHSDEWKIVNALSAGPASITEHAAVIDWPANPNDELSHGRVLRPGASGWTCMPDVPGRPQHNPMCVDETMMKWLRATLAGEKPDIDRVGLSYMLMGEARQGQGASPARDPSQVKEWFYVGPHIMVVLPDSAEGALRGINQDLSNNQPYTSFLSSADVATPIWVIPVAKVGGRIKEEPGK